MDIPGLARSVDFLCHTPRFFFSTRMTVDSSAEWRKGAKAARDIKTITGLPLRTRLPHQLVGDLTSIDRSVTISIGGRTKGFDREPKTSNDLFLLADNLQSTSNDDQSRAADRRARQGRRIRRRVAQRPSKYRVYPHRPLSDETPSYIGVRVYKAPHLKCSPER
ncbi:jg25182 [Pararge aegeria aegeria]|uniref:Jg25182 protein n=1 Tax=Pararge aegeria aegeria TaxID=348720 RepID=A0A8S4RYP4_9NEOP|nr:jg25182 [Pararge aegeria aegeria]